MSLDSKILATFTAWAVTLASSAVALRAQQVMWAQVDNLSPTPRYYHAAAFDSDRGVMIIIGGNTGETDTWEWDTDTRTWRLAAPSGVGPSRRGGHSMVFDAARHVTVLVGGWYNGTNYRDVWEWDGVDWTERKDAPLPEPRSAHAMAYDSARQRTVLYGGAVGTTNAHRTLEFDGANWAIVQTAMHPGNQTAHAMAYDSTRQVVVLADAGATDGVATPIWEYAFDADLMAMNWTPRAFATTPSQRDGPEMIFDEVGEKIMLYGGVEFNEAADKYRGVGDTWLYDGFQWEATSPGKERALFSMTYDSWHGVALTYSGNSFLCACNAFRDIQQWDGSGWSRTWSVTSIPPIFAPATAFDESRARTVLYGGQRLNPRSFSNVPPLSNTWEWTGDTWMRIATDHDPGPRYRAPLIYDAARNVTVLYGGTTDVATSTAVATTWEFNGVDWRQIGDGPGQRSRHAAAYDRDRRRLVVFGGWDQNGMELGDTVEFDGAQWTQLSATGPSPRRWASMAYDEANDRTVLFGGASGNALLNDTWAWDGANWARLDVPSDVHPPTRAAPGFVYARHLGGIVMFAGHASAAGGAAARNDLWLLRGSQWTPLPFSADSPTARAYFGFAYDTNRRSIVLTGGSSTSDRLFTSGQTWEAVFPCTTLSGDLDCDCSISLVTSRCCSRTLG